MIITFTDSVPIPTHVTVRQIVSEIDRRFIFSRAQYLYKLRQPYRKGADLGRGDWRLMRKEVRW